MPDRGAAVRRNARWLCAVALAFAWLGTHVRASAADDADKERARELMTKGRQARANADHATALQSFRKADDIMHVPTTALEVAKTLKDLGRLVDAAVTLESLEAGDRAPSEPEVFAAARRAAKEMALELGARIPRLRVTSTPLAAADTRVTLDGKPVDAGEAAAGLRVDPGRHVATAERQGAVQQRVVQLAESGSAEVAFDFGSNAGAVTAPPRPRAAKTSSSTYVVYGLSGLAVAGIGTGVGLAVWSSQRQSSLEHACAPRCSAQDVTDLRIGYVAANVTTAIGIGAGLAALTVYFVRADRRAPRRDAARSLSIAAGSGPGLTLAGTF